MRSRQSDKSSLTRSEPLAGGGSPWSNFFYNRPQRSWGKVMFSQASVILLTGGVSASVHAGIHSPPPQSRHPPGADTPWEQTPPGADTLQNRHPPEQTPPGADTPLEQTPPLGADTHTPWEQTHTQPGSRPIPPGSRHSPPGADTPPCRGTHPTGMQSCFHAVLGGKIGRIIVFRVHLWSCPLPPGNLGSATVNRAIFPRF